MTDRESMIPVFIPKEIGMRAVYDFALNHDCKLICSKSGALVLEPKKPVQSGTVARFPYRASTAPDFAPEIVR